MVLRTYKLGEADRIVVFLTEENGKVRAVAKGVRKTMSKFGARLEPMSHVTLLLYRGRNRDGTSLDIVSQAESVEPLAPMLSSLDRASQGIAVLEAADQLGLEREPNPQLYRMVVGVLRTIAERPAPLVVPAFYWKLLSAEGLRPELDVCVRCGESPDDGDVELVAFDLEEGGTLCRSCRSGGPISAAALDLLRMILGGRLQRCPRHAGVAGDPRGRRPRHPRPRAPHRTPPQDRRHVRALTNAPIANRWDQTGRNGPVLSHRCDRHRWDQHDGRPVAFDRWPVSAKSTTGGVRSREDVRWTSAVKCVDVNPVSVS